MIKHRLYTPEECLAEAAARGDGWWRKHYSEWDNFDADDQIRTLWSSLTQVILLGVEGLVRGLQSPWRKEWNKLPLEQRPWRNFI